MGLRVAANYYLPLWKKATADVSRLDERVAEARWQKATLNTLNALCWGDEAAVLPFVAARVIEAMGFNWGFARVLLKLAREFRRPSDWWPGRHHRTLDALAQVVEGADKEEWAGLEALFREADALNLAKSHRCILYLWRARNLLQQRRFQDALQACLDAEQVLPDDRSLSEALAGWFNHLGHIQEIQGDYNHALTLHQKALVRRTDNKGKALSHSNIGDMYRVLGRYEEAIAEYQRAIDLDPQSAYHHGLGNVYYTLSCHEKAIAEYRRAIEFDPQSAVSHNNLADVYMELGRLEEARREFEERVRLSPDDALNARVSLGIIAYHRGERAEAQQQFVQALNLWDTAQTQQVQTPATLSVDKAIALLGLGRVQEALDAMQEAQRQLLPGDRLEEYIKHLNLLTVIPEPPEGLDEVLTLLQEAAG